MDAALATPVDADWAFARYEALRSRLVDAPGAGDAAAIASVEAVAGEFDAFVLDAFGVLNVGEMPIPGAVERIARLRRRGKRLVVLTNGAAQSRRQALEKYRRLGFDFGEDEVVASRDVAAAALRRGPAGRVWAAAAGLEPDFADLDGLDVRDVLAEPELFATAEGFILFASAGWTGEHQRRLIAALAARPRPVVVANPDLVAPREAGFSLEPGHFGHALRDRLGLVPAFYGKPYADAFAVVRARLGPEIAAERTVMVGDTLHTDILGGRAAGFKTVLVTGHGLFAGHDPQRFIRRSGIVPDFVTRAI